MVEMAGPPLPELPPSGLPSVEEMGALPEPEGDVDPVDGEEVGAKLIDGVAPLVMPETGAVVADDASEDADPLAGMAAVPLGEEAPPEAGTEAVVE